MLKRSFFSRSAAVLLAASMLLSAASAAAPADAVIRSDDPLAGDGVVIAVIDSGFNPDHPAFSLPAGVSPAITGDTLAERAAGTFAAKTLAVPGGEEVGDLWHSHKIPFTYDYVSGKTDVAGGVTSHGTHVAALAAAGGTAEDTLPGAAPGAQLLLMKVFDDTGGLCDETNLVQAVRDAIVLKADVISLSLGSLSPSEEAVYMPYLARAIEDAVEAGILVVAAMGNDGETGIGGVDSDRMRTDNPDTGLPSEPAILSAVLSVGAAMNGVEYDFYLTAGESRVRFDLPAEVKTSDPTPADAVGTEPIPIVAVPGLGSPEDVAAVDLKGKVALIRRGEITFLEKIENAAAAGAVAAVIYNSEDGEAVTMSAAGASIPAVFVSYEDGLLLAEAETISFAAELGEFAASSAGMADFSARGPAADMQLTVDIAAVGAHVLSATGDGYDVLSGTSMAAPQIAGAAAAFISARRDYLNAIPAAERVGVIRAHLTSAAVPLTDAETGLPLSPRAQGAGVLDNTAAMTLTLTGETGRCAVELGQRLPAQVVFPLTVTNTGADAVTLTLTAVMTTEGYYKQDGVYYVSGKPEKIPGEIRFSAETLSVPAGEARTVTVTLVPDPDFLEKRAEIFENGFYLEGFVTASVSGEHAASLPFFGFYGNWDDAPILDGGDWDGYVSYYGGQQLLIKNTNGTFREAGGDSSLFAFSPDGDGISESVVWRLYPLRHAKGCRVNIFAEDGTAVAEYAYTAAEKTFYNDAGLLYHELSLWDGTDALNEHYFWPDGKYVARIEIHSFTGAVQTVEIPLTVDTAAPEITVSREGDVLTAAASDGGALTVLSVYAPDPEKPGENLYETSVTGTDGTLTLTAAFPEGAKYLYIRAEDAAGNVTVTRLYADAYNDTETEDAA